MKLPWVSRARYELLEHNMAEFRRLHAVEQSEHKARIESYHQDLNVAIGRVDAAGARERDGVARAEARYDALFAKYAELRQDGFSAPPAAPTLADPFGPLTRAALHDMGHGQSPMVRRAMKVKATALWLEQRGQEGQDEVVAIAIRRGEGPNL